MFPTFRVTPESRGTRTAAEALAQQIVTVFDRCARKDSTEFPSSQLSPLDSATAPRDRGDRDSLAEAAGTRRQMEISFFTAGSSKRADAWCRHAHVRSCVICKPRSSSDTPRQLVCEVTRSSRRRRGAPDRGWHA